MVRSILAVVAGIVVTVVFFVACEFLGWYIYLYPLGVNPMDTDTAKSISPPAGALLFVLLGYFAGTFCGVALAVRIARRAPAVHTVIICGLLMLANLQNLLEMPHPTWFWVASFAMFPLAGVAGALTGRPPRKEYPA
jgi:hypothetical protein